VTRSSSWTSAILLLPLLGWFALLPVLLSLPVYSDELEWKLMTSRLFLDGGKLVYVFPPCTRGRLLDVPVSWYPIELINALIYADMTNPQILRYWGVAIFCGLMGYATWFAWHRLRPQLHPLAICGGILVPLSFGVLPFLTVLNRPEQGLMLILVLACTLPFIFHERERERSPALTWLLALVYVLLSWMILAIHMKAVFLLPVMLLSACCCLRKWRPITLVVAAVGFGAWQTLTLWLTRADCPESPFLQDVFRRQNMSPHDLESGPLSFLSQTLANIRGVKDYWRATGFQDIYQANWLPPSGSPLTVFDKILNACVPILMAVAAVLIIRAFAKTFSQAVQRRKLPDPAASISMCLLLCLLAIACFQKGKNFYESSLAIPMLGLAVLLILPAQVTRKARIAFAGLAALAVASQLTLALSFYPHLAAWRAAQAARPVQQEHIRTLAARCGVKIDQTTSHLLVDTQTYTVLWPTRQLYFLHYLYGWWGTGTDPSQVIRDIGITGAIGECRFVTRERWASIVSDEKLCCAHV
jgi:hypothetical protein